jgi:hypothetical protein
VHREDGEGIDQIGQSSEKVLLTLANNGLAGEEGDREHGVEDVGALVLV